MQANMKSVAANLSLAASIIFLGAATISISYEIGYFSVIGSDFLLFFSGHDFITNTFNWLPITSFFFIIG